MADTQKMTRIRCVELNPIITPKIRGTSSSTLPLYRSYLNGKGGRSSLQSSIFIPNPDHTDVIKNGDLLPGDCIRTNQYEYRVKGRLPNTKVKEDP